MSIELSINRSDQDCHCELFDKGAPRHWRFYVAMSLIGRREQGVLVQGVAII